MKLSYVVPHSPESVGHGSPAEMLDRTIFLERYCGLMSAAGHDVELLFFSAEEPPSRVDYDVVGFSHWGSTYGRELSVELFGYLRDSNPDVVHVHGYNQLNTLVTLPLLSLGRPALVVQNHGPALNRSDAAVRAWYWFAGQLLRLPEKVLSVNREEIAVLLRAGVPRRKVCHVPNAVDPTLFAPADAAACRRELGLPVDGRYVLYVGATEESKGVEYLLRAVDSFGDEFDDVEFLFVFGRRDPDELRRLRSIRDTLGIEDRTRFLGPVPREELPRYYNAATACVFPSIREGFGIVTIEAMACETSVVGTRAHVVGGGHVRDGHNALVVEPASPESIASAVAELLTDADRRKRIAREGRRYVLENHTWERVGAALNRIYATVNPE